MNLVNNVHSYLNESHQSAFSSCTSRFCLAQRNLCWRRCIKLYYNYYYCYYWHNFFLFLCRTLDLLDQIGTGRALASPCWLFCWCCHSLDCPLFCCQKVRLPCSASVLYTVHQYTFTVCTYAAKSSVCSAVISFCINSEQHWKHTAGNHRHCLGWIKPGFSCLCREYMMMRI